MSPNISIYMQYPIKTSHPVYEVTKGHSGIYQESKLGTILYICSPFSPSVLFSSISFESSSLPGHQNNMNFLHLVLFMSMHLTGGNAYLSTNVPCGSSLSCSSSCVSGEYRVAISGTWSLLIPRFDLIVQYRLYTIFCLRTRRKCYIRPRYMQR